MTYHLQSAQPSKVMYSKCLGSQGTLRLNKLGLSKCLTNNIHHLVCLCVFFPKAGRQRTWVLVLVLVFILWGAGEKATHGLDI